jgi:hypothetical protein
MPVAQRLERSSARREDAGSSPVRHAMENQRKEAIADNELHRIEKIMQLMGRGLHRNYDILCAIQEETDWNITSDEARDYIQKAKNEFISIGSTINRELEIGLALKVYERIIEACLESQQYKLAVEAAENRDRLFVHPKDKISLIWEEVHLYRNYLAMRAEQGDAIARNLISSFVVGRVPNV